ncbi:methyltransferase family protein [Mycobacterium asiaticum]|uniref:Isoprenylcysteine carboxyl methyltransferase n=1 Tax=Mycobacterium asiaticum TaxID=1790 RepID=A0A1A3KQE0_MYCAS|nr:isoprenylcysteine carboxylmethyltransferase family protein [Mycobacterium asiaticum]OBJ87225.1 isoprenylcysteine carboxyl methyltransferase [Mycobacterium asiaticum]
MALAALTLYLLLGALAFGWRSWRQHRSTGSTGFRGISGHPGSLEWFAGVGFAVALVAGVGSAALQLLGSIAPIGILHQPWIQWAGLLLALTGIAATVYAQIDMGEAWRIGVDESESTTLVRNGTFGLVRNPIFTALILFATGNTLVAPNVVAVIGLIALVASIEIQVRVVEEPYLRRTHGEAYLDYTRSVGRFLPRIGIT